MLRCKGRDARKHAKQACSAEMASAVQRASLCVKKCGHELSLSLSLSLCGSCGASGLEEMLARALSLSLSLSLWKLRGFRARRNVGTSSLSLSLSLSVEAAGLQG